MSKMKILITAGPTRERIDPVRFISNRSSGKMGYALAEAAAASGLETVLVSGPVCLTAPENLRTVHVESAEDMAREVFSEAATADIIVMAAAVADYRPAKTYTSKIKKEDNNFILELESTTDILTELGRRKKEGQVLAGFAAETENLLENAEKKLKNKNLDWIIANDVSASDAGFQSDMNRVIMLSAKGRRFNFPLMPKKELAVKIMQILTEMKQLS